MPSRSGPVFGFQELHSLTPESFDLDADPPTITCLGENTKNGKIAVQPIRPELADMLRPWLSGKAPGKPVFALARACRCDGRCDWTLKPLESIPRHPSTSIACATLRLAAGQERREREGLPGTCPALGPETHDEHLHSPDRPRRCSRARRAFPHPSHKGCLNRA